MTTATPAPINTGATYHLDEGGNFVQTRATHPLRGSFAGFYEPAGRPELTGTNAYGVDWLNLNRPGVDRFSGRSPKNRTYSAGRGFETPEPKDYGPPQESHDISGISNVRPSPGGLAWGEQGEQFSSTFGGADKSHRLRNVRNATTPGTGMTAAAGTSPSQSFAGSGGGWEHVAGMVTTGRAALGAGRAALHAGQGALSRGSQFVGMVGSSPSAGAVGAAPRAFGELGPAGSSSYTVKTNSKGQMGWDF